MKLISPLLILPMRVIPVLLLHCHCQGTWFCLLVSVLGLPVWSLSSLHIAWVPADPCNGCGSCSYCWRGLAVLTMTSTIFPAFFWNTFSALFFHAALLYSRSQTVISDSGLCRDVASREAVQSQISFIPTNLVARVCQTFCSHFGMPGYLATFPAWLPDINGAHSGYSESSATYSSMN